MIKPTKMRKREMIKLKDILVSNKSGTTVKLKCGAIWSYDNRYENSRVIGQAWTKMYD